MTIARTIAIADQHAANGNVPAACRILDGAIRAAMRPKGQMQLSIAKQRILDAAVDATVARSQARARQMNAELPAAQAEVLKLKGMI